MSVGYMDRILGVNQPDLFIESIGASGAVGIFGLGLDLVPNAGRVGIRLRLVESVAWEYGFAGFWRSGLSLMIVRGSD